MSDIPDFAVPVHMFHPVHMPELIEAYRGAVYEEVYRKMPPVMLKSLCWATSELHLPPEQQSLIMVMPGEEVFLRDQHGINFNLLNQRATCCPHRKEETRVLKDIEGIPTGTKTAHFCRLSPKERPLFCRMWPIQPKKPTEVSATSNRAAELHAEVKAFDALTRSKGEGAVNQLLWNAANAVMAFWPFMSSAWWKFHSKRLSHYHSLRKIIRFEFELPEDNMVSVIKGASDIWRTRLLAQLSREDCETCEGTGIEFWDQTLEERASGGSRLIPRDKRKFDLCRDCVLVSIGVRFKDLLVDPHSKKVLTATGDAYRGDKI